MATQPDESYYGGQTVTGAGWPHVNEDVLDATADAFDDLRTFLRDVVVPAAGRQRTKLSDRWEGAGAQAAYDEASAIILAHEASEQAAKETRDQLRLMFAAVKFAKTAANKTAEEVQAACEKIMGEKPPAEGEDTRNRRAADKVKEGYEENVRLVSEFSKWLAEKLDVPPDTPGADGKVPTSEAEGKSTSPAGEEAAVGGRGSAGGTGVVADQPPPPSLFSPVAYGGKGTAQGTGVVADSPPADGPVKSESGGGRGPASVPNDVDTPATVGGDNSPSANNPEPGTPSISVSGGGGAPSPSGAPQGPRVSPMSSGTGKADAVSAETGLASSPTPATSGGAPQNPAEQFQKGLADAAKNGGSPQTLSSTPSQPLGGPPTTQPLGTPPPTAGPTAPPTTGGPPAPVAQAAGGPGGGAGPAPVAPPPSGGVPGGAVPLGPPPTPPLAAPVTTPSPAAGPPVAPTGAAAGAAGGGGAQVAPIPVSAARAERDLAQRAVRRSGVDPMETARRIAAALNAPGMTNVEDFKFFWVTGLTTDGKIVVANNYGIAYIPQQVHLPEQVHMASADESISPAERASWVNEPIVAVQRWAEHNGKTLRAVIATEDQLKNSDAGVHHEVLKPEDIPESGKMAGRDRLQVIAPDVSSQLARISDTDLVSVLPPAPADSNPPEDSRKSLWDNVWKPLASRSAKRGERHLTAFVAYAAHAQEHALYAAHTAALPDEQRQAIREFIYWQHVGQLTADALAPA